MPEVVEKPASMQRRLFLAGVATAPVVAAGMLLCRAQAQQQIEVAVPVAAPTGLGYQETDHVRRYYRSAAGF